MIPFFHRLVGLQMSVYRALKVASYLACSSPGWAAHRDPISNNDTNKCSKQQMVLEFI